MEGLVRQPLGLTYDEIASLPKVSLTEDFRCLEGWIVRGVEWEGVNVSSVLKLTELKPEATSITFASGDYNTVLQVSKALGSSIKLLRLSMYTNANNCFYGGPVWVRNLSCAWVQIHNPRGLRT